MPAADLSAVPTQIARANAETVARLAADNQEELSRAAAVTDIGLRQAGADLLAGDPVKAVRDVASVVAADVDTLAHLAVEDASLPAQLVATDAGILVGTQAEPAAALLAGPSTDAHNLRVQAA